MNTYRLYVTPSYCVRFDGHLSTFQIVCLRIAGFKVKIWTG